MIREATALDLEACVALARLADPGRTAAEWRRALRDDVEYAERLLLVADEDGELVGYGRARLLEPGTDAPADAAPAGYYLSGVVVAPGRRRGGIGSALTRARLDWIGGRADDAWFFTNARNTASIGLHRRFGFEEVGRDFSVAGVVFEGGEGILFRLRLRPPT